ncbi:hypothetical protein RJ641_020523 [Dillenia turbinata]|uniref:Uncharacterized protein n=1 Tax=Dillenia turbinata TaxID=194707 RepID=A0AAN8YWA3_9MAGN
MIVDALIFIGKRRRMRFREDLKWELRFWGFDNRSLHKVEAVMDGMELVFCCKPNKEFDSFRALCFPYRSLVKLRNGIMNFQVLDEIVYRGH